MMGMVIQSSTSGRYAADSAMGNAKWRRMSPVLASQWNARYLLRNPNQPSSTESKTEWSKQRNRYHESMTVRPMLVASPSAVGDSIASANSANANHRNVYTMRSRRSGGTTAKHSNTLTACITSRFASTCCISSGSIDARDVWTQRVICSKWDRPTQSVVAHVRLLPSLAHL